MTPAASSIPILFFDAGRPLVAQLPIQRQPLDFIWLQQSTTDALHPFAEMTRARAFFNTNDLTTSFKRAADDSFFYYLLATISMDTTTGAGWRSLKVKVDEKDVEVRARK